jgi:hypothetical protein
MFMFMVTISIIIVFGHCVSISQEPTLLLEFVKTFHAFGAFYEDNILLVILRSPNLL